MSSKPRITLYIDEFQRVAFIGLAAWYVIQTKDIQGCLVVLSTGFVNQSVAHMIITEFKFLKSRRIPSEAKGSMEPESSGPSASHDQINHSQADHDQ